MNYTIFGRVLCISKKLVPFMFSVKLTKACATESVDLPPLSPRSCPALPRRCVLRLVLGFVVFAAALAV